MFRQVCIPGLHVTLGIFLKLFNLFEDYCHQLDIEIAANKEQSNTEIEDSNFGDHVKTLTQLRAKKSTQKDIEHTLELTMDEVNWFVISGGSNVVVDNHYQPMIDDLQNKLEAISTEIEDLEKKNLDKGAGPCASSLDTTLKSLGVERQAYYGKIFIGNHCHKLLRVSNVYYGTFCAKNIKEKHEIFYF